MKRNGFLTILALALLLVNCAYSQEQRTEMCVYFRPNSSVIDSTYMDNAAHPQEITAALRNIRRQYGKHRQGLTQWRCFPKGSCEIQSEPEPVEDVAPAIPVEEGWHRQLHLKTNAVGWVLLITNLAVEVDLAKHWSLTFPHISLPGTISLPLSSSVPSPYNRSYVIGSPKRTIAMRDGLSGHTSGWHTSTSLSMVIIATKTINVIVLLRVVA